MTIPDRRHTVHPMPIARRTARRLVSPTEALESVIAAHDTYRRARDDFNAAIHARARAVHDAHAAGLTWPAIGEPLGITPPALRALAKKYATAVRHHRTVSTYTGGKP